MIHVQCIMKLVGCKVYGEIFTDFSDDFARKLIWFISGIYAWALNLKKGK